MTIEVTSTVIRYNGNGVATEFSFPFMVTDKSELRCVLLAADGTETDLTVDTDFTVEGVGVEGDGIVTYPKVLEAPEVTPDPMPVGQRLTIYRQTERTQQTNFTSQGTFSAETHEDAFDRMVMLIQECQEKVDRTFTVSITSTEGGDSLTEIVAEATAARAGAEAAQAGAVHAQGHAETAQGAAEGAAVSAAASALAAAASAANSGLPAPSVADKGKVPIVNDAGTGYVLGAGGLAWGIVATDTNAAKGNGYLVNASAANVTITLPSAPAAGDMVGISDFYGAARSYTVKLARNGKNIQGAAADWTATSASEAIVVVYSDATQGWIITERYQGTASSTPTGTIAPFVGATAPTGWAILTGASAVRTIGDASSGASLASATTSDLFTLLWNSMADGQAAVSSGRGATAAADFAAHKTITIPDPRGRALIGAGTGSGLTARTHGATGGAETHQLSEAELASHAHNQAAYACAISAYACLTNTGSGYNTGYAGSNSAHANMQPWMATHLIIKL
jgi:microcystin-dependent protein